MISTAQAQIDFLRRFQPIRSEFLATLTDADMTYRLPGNNVSLGELLRETGEITQSYIQTYINGKQDFSWRYEDPTIINSIERLTIWLDHLDQDLIGTLSRLSDDDFQTRTFERGGMTISLRHLFDVYQDAMLIQFAKLSIYAKALEKALPPMWQRIIG